jgi:bifunctional non-homologous end joining protein LigD
VRGGRDKITPMPNLKSDATRLVLTNLQKVFWPETGYTKGNLLDYYRDIAPVILPYLKDRPQSLHRHVDGHTGKGFFQRIPAGISRPGCRRPRCR